MERIQSGAKVIVITTSTGLLLYGFWLSTKSKQKLLSEEERVLGILLSTAVGDAKGIPNENKTFEQLKKENKRRSTEIYSQVVDHPFIPIDHPPGVWTDDTQLSLSVCEAIIEAKGVDMEKIAAYHVKAFHETTTGWGGTRNAVKRLADKTHTFQNCGNEGATGNGVVMKMAPLAYFYSKQSATKYPDHKKFQEIEQFTRMTHNNTLSVVASAFHCKMMERLYRQAKNGTNVFDSDSARRDFLENSIICAIEQEMRFSFKEREEWQNKGDLLSHRLRQLLQCLIDSKGLTDEKLVEISHGGTYYVINSLTMVYGLFVQSEPSFDVILKACFIGGDTDSNAAMVGAMIGGLKGPKIIPKEYLDKLYKLDHITAIAKKFAASLE